MEQILRHGTPGMVIRGQVTHLAPFGAFVDVGCGLVALLPLANISVARIRHPAERFALHQRIRAVVQSIDPQQKAHRPQSQGAAGNVAGERRPLPGGRDGAGHCPRLQSPMARSWS